MSSAASVSEGPKTRWLLPTETVVNLRSDSLHLYTGLIDAYGQCAGTELQEHWFVFFPYRLAERVDDRCVLVLERHLT